MMGVAQLLEEFGRAPDPQSQVQQLEDEDLEDLKLKSFEEGYGAGWEDAIKAQSERGELLSDAVQGALMNLHTTQEEVLKSYIEATRGLFVEIVSKVLPDVANRALGDHIVSLLENATREQAEVPIEIRVAPDEAGPITTRLKDILSDETTVRPDDDLQPGQACLAFGKSEKQIDLTTAISEIGTAIDAFHATIQEGN